MKLVKIHRILSCKQSDWLKYVGFNTKKRRESTDEFNKNLYKLLNINKLLNIASMVRVLKISEKE